jgi:hypothetical protein
MRDYSGNRAVPVGSQQGETFKMAKTKSTPRRSKVQTKDAAKLKASAAARKEREAQKAADAKIKEQVRQAKKRAAEAAAKGARSQALRQLAPVAKEINHRLDAAAKAEDNAYDHRLSAALRCAEAKRVCAEKHIPFKPWAEQHLQHSYETVRKYVRIGEADNPEEALTVQREANRLANHALRGRLAVAGSNTVKTAKKKISGQQQRHETQRQTPVNRIIEGFQKVDEDAGSKLVKSHALNYGLIAVSQAEAVAMSKLRKRTPLEQVEIAFALLNNAQKLTFLTLAAQSIGASIVTGGNQTAVSTDDADLDIPAFLDQRKTKKGRKQAA